MKQALLYHVDAFADRPFSGNPAAVCVLSEARDEQWMQHAAAEMNLSETAFLHPDGAVFQLRWFTPTIEVALCGHATLASAHILWETGRLTSESAAQFHTKSGLLTCTRRGAEVEMNFPARHCRDCCAGRTGVSRESNQRIVPLKTPEQLEHARELLRESTAEIQSTASNSSCVEPSRRRAVRVERDDRLLRV